MSVQISIRDAYPSDLAYVKNAIEGTLRDNSAFCKGIHPATLTALIDPILAAYQVVVATPAEDTDTVLGFLVCRDPTTVAFLYVRSEFRKGGLARALLAHAGIERAKPGASYVPEIACAFMVTKMENHRGQAFAALAEAKGYRLRFRPYLPLEIMARIHYGGAGKDAG